MDLPRSMTKDTTMQTSVKEAVLSEKNAPQEKCSEVAEARPTAAELEEKFMAALQRLAGPGVELTEEKVRELIASLTPEQRQELRAEGQGLRSELLRSADDYHDELQQFRKELNNMSEKSDLPVEKDGEHLTKKVVSCSRVDTDIPLRSNVLGRHSTSYG